MVLALHLYNQDGIHPSSDRLTKLSRELREHLTRRDGHPLANKVRSTTSVSAKLRAFEALRLKTGSTRGDSALLREVWAGYGRDRKKVWDEAKRIRDNRAASASDTP